MRHLNREKLVYFLTRNRVDYGVEGTENVGKHWIGVNCPYCDSDTGHHMGIKYGKSPRASCWRSSTHNTSVEKALSSLTGVPVSQIVLELEESAYYDELNMQLNAIMEKDQSIQEVEWPTGVHPLSQDMGEEYSSYLSKRGWGPIHYGYLSSVGVHVGKFRIWFPITVLGHTLGYTGRAIAKNPKLRYYHKGVKRLGFADVPPDAEKVLVVEGFFDALPINFWYEATKVWAVCITGLDPNLELANQLQSLSYKYTGKIYSLLDTGTDTQARQFQVEYGIAPLSMEQFLAQAESLPAVEEPKDPGDLTLRSVRMAINRMKGR